MDKSSPEFHSKYHSCESNLFLEFSSLNMLLHLESLQELIKFAMDVQSDLNDIMSAKPKLKLQHPSSTRMRGSFSRQISEIGIKSSKQLGKYDFFTKRNYILVSAC